MSTSAPNRKEQRDLARDERKRREQEDAQRAQRKRRLTYLGGGLLVVIAIVAIVIAVASGGGSASSTSSGGGVKNAAAVTKEFAGIPQSGNVLGASNAKATMMVFADLQCPFCAEFETHALPGIVSRYVKSGRLKIEFQPISIIGNDSVAGARAAASAAQQDKLFQYSSLFYGNQGQENTGYVTDKFLTDLARAVPGLNVSKWRADLTSPKAAALLSQAQSAAQTARVNSTPTFMVAKSGQTLEQFAPTSLSADAFYGRLDRLTK